MPAATPSHARTKLYYKKQHPCCVISTQLRSRRRKAYIYISQMAAKLA